MLCRTPLRARLRTPLRTLFLPALLLAVSTALPAAAHAQAAQAQDKAEAEQWLQQWLDSHPPGYLKENAPNSLEISPPPPAPGSLWAELDETVAKQAVAMRGSERFEQARRDAQMQFPESAQHFACAVGVPIDEEHTPTVYQMLRRTQTDAGHYAVHHAKDHYMRQRPFMVSGEPTCTPEHEPGLRMNGSYPSGHTAIGWTWALMLAEIAPERATDILNRGRSYGHSRIVCNVHWYSDVMQGQALAASLIASLNGTADFARDLAIAREEVAKARTLNLPMPHDCAAEAAVLEQSPLEAR